MIKDETPAEPEHPQNCTNCGAKLRKIAFGIMVCVVCAGGIQAVQPEVHPGPPHVVPLVAMPASGLSDLPPHNDVPGDYPPTLADGIQRGGTASTTAVRRWPPYGGGALPTV